MQEEAKTKPGEHFCELHREDLRTRYQKSHDECGQCSGVGSGEAASCICEYLYVLTGILDSLLERRGCGAERKGVTTSCPISIESS